MSWLRDGLLGLLFPPRCLLCGMVLSSWETLCSACTSELERTRLEEQFRCEYCQEPLEDVRVDICHVCATHDRRFDRVRSLGSYEGSWGELVRALKFGRERRVAYLLARYLAAYIWSRRPFGVIDVITYVPMGRVERRRRGFNQARFLARALGKQLSIPVLPLMAKVRRTRLQAGLPARERRKNLQGAFQQIRFAKGKILLVDDVYTTGATVEECARVLKAGGHKTIFVLTVARA